MTPIRRVLQVLMLLLLVCSTSLLSAQESEVTPEVTEPITLAPETVTPEPTDLVVTEVPPTAEPMQPDNAAPPTAEPVQPDNAAPTPAPNTVSAALTAPRLRTPRRDTVLADRTPTFTWNAVTGSKRYVLRLYDEAPLLGSPGTLRYSADILTATSFTLPRNQRLRDGIYYWTVTALKRGVEGPSSESRRFIIQQSGDMTPPTAADDQYALESGETIDDSGLLSNDTVNRAAISAVNGGAALNGVPTEHGSVTVAADGVFTYTAVTDYVGPDTFSYTLSNGGGSASAEVDLFVGVAPVAVNDTYELFILAPDDQILENLTLGDEADELGDPAAAVVWIGGGSLGGTVTTFSPPVSQPLAGGTLTINPDGEMMLAPLAETPLIGGVYSFKYRLANEIGYSDASVQITVCTSDYREEPPCDDFDHDGLRDAWELEWFETMEENGLGDGDNDQCNHACEFEHGTAPTDPDTDWDTLQDGEEIFGIELGGVTYTFNPLLVDSDGDFETDRTEVMPRAAGERYLVIIRDIETAEGTMQTLTVPAPGILANDTLRGAVISAVNGRPELVGVTTALNQRHTLTMNLDGSFIFSTRMFSGPSSFTYTLTNRFGSVTVKVEVPVGIPPDAKDDHFLISTGQSLSASFTKPNWTWDNTDVYGLSGTIIASLGGGELGAGNRFEVPSSLPFAGGIITFDSEGNFTLTGSVNEGVYTFDYRLSNFMGWDEARVTIVVCAPNSSLSACADTDRDGMADDWEIDQFGSLAHTALMETDGDSCRELCEFIYRVDPHMADTDDDGLKDGYEVLTPYASHDAGLPDHTDPGIPDMDDDHLRDGEEVTGIVYGISWTRPHAVSNPLMFDTDGDTLNDCQELGGQISQVADYCSRLYYSPDGTGVSR